MILTINWSPGIKIQYGKNIRVKYSKEDFSIKIVEGAAQKMFHAGNPLEKEYIIYAHEISDIANPLIQFKSEKGTDISIEFELFN